MSPLPRALETGRQLANHPDEAICVFGPQLTLWFVSEAAAAALGLQAEEMVSRRWTDLFPALFAAQPLANRLQQAWSAKTAAVGSFGAPASDGVRWLEFVLMPQFGVTADVDFVVARLRPVSFAEVLAGAIHESRRGAAPIPSGEGRTSLPVLMQSLEGAGIRLSPASARWLATLRPESALVVGDYEPLRLAFMQLALCAHAGASGPVDLSVTPRDAGVDRQYLSLEFLGFRCPQEASIAGWPDIRALIEEYGGTALLIQPPGGTAVVELILRLEDLERCAVPA